MLAGARVSQLEVPGSLPIEGACRQLECGGGGACVCGGLQDREQACKHAAQAGGSAGRTTAAERWTLAQRPLNRVAAALACCLCFGAPGVNHGGGDVQGVAPAVHREEDSKAGGWVGSSRVFAAVRRCSAAARATQQHRPKAPLQTVPLQPAPPPPSLQPYTPPPSAASLTSAAPPGGTPGQQPASRPPAWRPAVPAGCSCAPRPPRCPAGCFHR